MSIYIYLCISINICNVLIEVTGVFVPIVYAASDIKIEGDMQLLNLRDFVLATLVKNEFQILQVCKNKS